MPGTLDDLLSIAIGGITVADHLRRAVESGALKQHDDGTWELPPRASAVSPWLYHRPIPQLPCQFLARFLFDIAYAKSAVPQGCESCYKVKVIPRTLRELVALWGVAQRFKCLAKCGLDIYNPFSQNIYAGLFYTDGLDGAREMFRIVREAVNVDPKLGPAVPMVIKRGCSDFEAACGPSNQYTFRAELPELEAYLKSRFRMPANKENDKPATFLAWLDTAYRIGDETYLDFTHGNPLRPQTVTYNPEGG